MMPSLMIEGAIESLRVSLDELDAQLMKLQQAESTLIAARYATVNALTLLGADARVPSRASVESDRPSGGPVGCWPPVTDPSPSTGSVSRSAAEDVYVAAPPKRSRRSTVDKAEVARVALEAIAAGLPMGDAVAKHFGIKPYAAAKRIIDARNAGYPIPKAQGGKRMPVADLVIPDTQALAPEQVCTCDVSESYRREDRSCPVHAPAPAAAPDPTRARPVSSGLVLACEMCPAEFAADRLLDLRRHTLNEHGRHPTNAERTPTRSVA